VSSQCVVDRLYTARRCLLLFFTPFFYLHCLAFAFQIVREPNFLFFRRFSSVLTACLFDDTHASTCPSEGIACLALEGTSPPRVSLKKQPILMKFEEWILKHREMISLEFFLKKNIDSNKNPRRKRNKNKNPTTAFETPLACVALSLTISLSFSLSLLQYPPIPGMGLANMGYGVCAFGLGIHGTRESGKRQHED
jgi:hypothetical protein